MFTFDPESSYMMPAHFGPRQFDPRASGWYHDVTAMTLSYVTDRDALARYVPAPFEVTDEAVVTVVYANNRRVDWLAGHGYNLIGVSASVRFNGESDTIDGQFTLVMWENLTVSDLRPPTDDEIAATADTGQSTAMGWRYLPGVSGFGETASQPTAFPSESTITDAWVGSGSIDWHRLTWEQNPTQFHIVNALADLPVLEQRPAIVSRGSTNLILLDDLPRAIS